MQIGKDFIGVSCGAQIINEKKQILLMKRSKKCKNKPGYWMNAGGKVEFFEKIENAVKREVMEELGVKIKILKLLPVLDDIKTAEKQHWIAPQFLCKITKGAPRNKEPEKCEEIKWFNLEKIPKKTTKTTKNGVREIKKIVK
ncbi:MAG: NUDIX domain-containing protein [Candidatus Diapherotrites archaeon]|nr:NUDIX domain-containing protein [Candidatus Diapherotrites archaeon]